MPHKTKKLKGKYQESSSNNSSSESEYDWKQPDRNTQEQLKKEGALEERGWITDVGSMDSFFDTFTSKSGRNKTKNVIQETSKANELNPYFKDGGSGLPTNERASKSILSKENHSWLHKSFNRCVETSKETGVNLRDILLQRWDANTVDDMLRTFGDSASGAKPRWRKSQSFNSLPSSSLPPSSCSKDHSSERIEPLSKKDERSPVNSVDDQHKTFEERLVTNDDINSMAAKVMRAELESNPTKVAKLKANLDKLREAMRRGLKVRLHTVQKKATNNSVDDNQSRVIELTRLNDQGVEMPVHIQNLPGAPVSGNDKRLKRFKTHDSSGRRTAFFLEDNKNQDVTDMIREERLRSAGDMDVEFSKLADKNVEDEYGDAFVKKRVHSEREAIKCKQDAVSSYKRRMFAESRCSTCLERVPKYLIVSLGEKVFLSLPSYISMVSGYCLITPYEHIGSITRLDEDAVKEIRNFKCQLTAMFDKHYNESGCVFIETATKSDGFRYHTQVECIPVPRNLYRSLPAYFKKALSEIGSEWDQNRRLITIKPGGSGAYGVIPPKFAYLAVEFGTVDGGFARILDEEHEISAYTGREIVAGALNKEPLLWRKPKPESFEHLREKVVAFESVWHSFDKWQDNYPNNLSNDIKSNYGNSLSNDEPEGPALPPGY
ncbi:unnamed protein product [Trichobilharzia szidati]|nr:unnamed protein product [Trichobilharzia szidati]